MRSNALVQPDRSCQPLAESHARPDPVLTANLYCHGALDELLIHAILPFRDRLRSAGLREVSLWLLRYGKGGEHIKIRIHGPSTHLPRLRQLLESSAEAAWVQIPPSPRERTRAWRGAPVVDEEDAVPEDHADRTLVWTRYRRSPVSLGGGGLPEADGYVALATSCLAAGCDRVLDVFKEHGLPISPGRKQRALLPLFLEALAALDWPASLWHRYLAYHRDALFRFLLAPNDTPGESAVKLSHRCDRLSRAQDPEGVLTMALKSSLEGPLGTMTAWQQAVGGLHRWVSDPHNLPRRLDPFAWEPRFTPIFKVLHGVSNQLGVSLLNEGFLCHLLLAKMGVQIPPVAFHPGFEWAEA